MDEIRKVVTDFIWDQRLLLDTSPFSNNGDYVECMAEADSKRIAWATASPLYYLDAVKDALVHPLPQFLGPDSLDEWKHECGHIILEFAVHRWRELTSHHLQIMREAAAYLIGDIIGECILEEIDGLPSATE